MIVSGSEQQHQKAQQSWSTYRFSEVTLAGLRRFYEGDKSFIVKSGEPGEGDIEEAILSFQSDYAERRGGVEILALIKNQVSTAVLCSRIDRIAYLIECAKMLWCDELITALEEENKFSKEIAEIKAAQVNEEAYLKALNACQSRLKTDRLRLDSMLSEQKKPKQDNRSEEVKRKELLETHMGEIVAVEEMLKMQINEDTTTVEKYCGYIRRLQRQIEHMNKAQGNGRRVNK